MINLTLIGPPGSGKGTQASKISQHLKIVHISTGDILREAVKQKTPLGIEAQKYMAAGGLVPDQLIMDMVRERVSQKDCANGVLLDGFPRTIPQAQMLDTLPHPAPSQKYFLDKIISFDLSEEKCIERLANRRTCPQCKLTFNPSTHPPKKEGVCDQCGSALILREDDKVETIKERLKVYNNQTEPLIRYYQETQRLLSVDASFSPENVFSKVINLL